MQTLNRCSILIALILAAFAGRAIAAADDAKDNNDGGGGIEYPRRALAAREIELAAAQKNLDMVSEKLRTKFEQSKEWKKAQEELKQAQSDKDAAVKPVLDKLHDTPEYKSALDAKTAAAAAADKARSSGEGPDAVMAAAKAAAQANGALVKMDADAIAADPAAKAANAKALEASQKCADLQKQFNDSIKLSPEFDKASKRLEEARQRRERAVVAVHNMEQNAKHKRRK